MRDSIFWKETVISTRFSTTVSGSLEAANLFGKEQLLIPEPHKRSEKERAVAWSNGRALYDQRHRQARSHRLEASEDLQGLLRNFLAQFSRNGMPGQHSHWEKPFPNNIRSDLGPAISSEGPNLIVNNIANTNQGNRR